MPVLDRAALEQSPLADLHAIASELSIDGYRRLRKAELIDVILGGSEAQPAKSAGKDEPAEADSVGEAAAEDAGARAQPPAGGEDEEPGGARRRRGRRGGRTRAPRAELAEEPSDAPEAEAAARPEAADAAAGPASRPSPEPEERTEPIVEGVVELLPNGSGFVRVSPPDPSDDDVYISAAQVKRCELVSGDRVTGPRRAPRRSERFASLVRVDTINDADAGELSSGARFDDLPAEFPNERFRLGSEDPTVKAIEFLTPFGKGSRVLITGASRSGKSEALQRLAAALRAQEGLQVSVVLAGVRPEELALWSQEGAAPAAAVSFAASADAQDDAVELVVDQARRIAVRGTDAVVLIDTLDGVHPYAARKVLAAARNLSGGGSLTVIATSTLPLGGETTVIALDLRLASTGRFPALDLAASGTLRPELLVGEVGAGAIADARSQALDA